MNKKNLILTPTKEMDRQQWLQFRSPVYHVGKLIEAATGFNPKNFTEDDRDEFNYAAVQEFFTSKVWADFVFPCIGASEMATVMGLNEYKSSIELFYEKVGVTETPDFDNIAMFWGRELEAQIADKWQYWDGSEETLLENFRDKKILRKNRRINAYLQNKEFPYIFVSIDRIINKSNGTGEGSLECKTISGWSADKWEAGIPPAYVVQEQTQLLAAEFTFGEIAILKDGRHFEVIPFDRNDSICSSIKAQAAIFYSRVKGAIEWYFLSLAAYADEIKRTCLYELDKFSPEPDSSISYENYLKKKHEDTGGEIQGTVVEDKLCVDYLYYKAMIEEQQDKQRECSNKLKAYMGEASTMFIPNGDHYVTWKANKNGTRMFKVTVKKSVH